MKLGMLISSLFLCFNLNAQTQIDSLQAHWMLNFYLYWEHEDTSEVETFIVYYGSRSYNDTTTEIILSDSIDTEGNETNINVAQIIDDEMLYGGFQLYFAVKAVRDSLKSTWTDTINYKLPFFCDFSYNKNDTSIVNGKDQILFDKYYRNTYNKQIIFLNTNKSEKLTFEVLE